MEDRIDAVLKRVDQYRQIENINWSPEQYWAERLEKEAKEKRPGPIDTQQDAFSSYPLASC